MQCRVHRSPRLAVGWKPEIECEHGRCGFAACATALSPNIQSHSRHNYCFFFPGDFPLFLSLISSLHVSEKTRNSWCLARAYADFTVGFKLAVGFTPDFRLLAPWQWSQQQVWTLAFRSMRSSVQWLCAAPGTLAVPCSCQRMSKGYCDWLIDHECIPNLFAWHSFTRCQLICSSATSHTMFIVQGLPPNCLPSLRLWWGSRRHTATPNIRKLTRLEHQWQRKPALCWYFSILATL